MSDATNHKPDTIFALATLPGRSGVAVMRVSGPDAGAAVDAMCGARPSSRTASLRRLTNPKTGGAIDEGLVLWFQGPASFTGEDVCEFQVHGSSAVTEALASALLDLGLRQALPGEFTRRAFENGRMDLTEAEGLADLIDSETEAQRQQALRQMDGGLRHTYEGWQDLILDALAAIEGEIDFPDEADVPDALSHRAYAPLSDLRKKLQETLADSERGERIRHGLDIAVVGAPNAGKSSIINRLANREAAIVSDIAGTTRDIVEVNLVINGLPVRLSDTAGLRESTDAIEAEGVRRALTRAGGADLRIGVIDGSGDAPNTDVLTALSAGDLIVINKADLGDTIGTQLGLETLTVSAKTGSGFKGLQKRLNSIVTERFGLSSNPGLTRARHKDCVTRALSAVERSIDSLAAAPELAGEDLRSALYALRELAGHTDIEAVLDRVFSRFCIGK